MKTPLISVIVPVYNSMKYLDECVQSVLSQSYNNIEIILVDDGSTDDSPAMCDNYASAYPNIKVLHQKNGGLSFARNAGMNAAAGQYFTFVDSDDIIDTNMISSLVELAVKENADIVKIGLKRVYPGEECLAQYGDYEVISPIEAIKKIYDPEAKIITTCGKLFSAHLFKNFDFPVGIYYEDEYTTPRLFFSANKVVVSQKQLYFYMQRDNESIIRGRLNGKKVSDSLFVLRDRLEFFKSIDNKTILRLAKTDYYYKLLKLYSQTKTEPGLSGVHDNLAHEIELYEKDNRFITTVIRVKLSIHKFIKNLSLKGVES